MHIFLDAEVRTHVCNFALEAAAPYEAAHPCTASLAESMAVKQAALFELAGASEAKDRLSLTGSAEEACQTVLWNAFFERARQRGQTYFVTSCLEEAPLLQTLKRFEEMGCFVHIVRATKEGKIDLEHLQTLLSPRTALVAFSLASPLTGIVQPVDEIAAVVRAHSGADLYFEASRAAGKMPLRFSDWDIDFLSFGGHLFHAGSGSGALFSKKKPLSSLVARPLDVASFFRFTAGASQAALLLDRFSLETPLLRKVFEEEAMRRLPGVFALWQKSSRLPHTSLLVFPEIHQETLLYFLSQKGVFASMGGGALPLLAPLLASLGFVKEGPSTVSFSFSRYTTREEIERALSLLEEVFLHLQKGALR